MINCKEFCKVRKEKIAATTQGLNKKLIIFQVGYNEASTRYVRNKMKDCAEVGIVSNLVQFSLELSEEEIVEEVSYVIQSNQGPDTYFMVQLPLPSYMDEKRILELIPADKDVDGLTSKTDFTPCTPKGVMMILEDIKEDVAGKHVVVIGRSHLVGKPLVNLLIEKQATVTCINSKTNPDTFKFLLKSADIIVSAVGKRNLLTKENTLPCQTIIDVGINFDEDGKMCGDCNKELYDINEKITTVPGGVGLYTRVALLDNIKGEHKWR